MPMPTTLKASSSLTHSSSEELSHQWGENTGGVLRPRWEHSPPPKPIGDRPMKTDPRETEPDHPYIRECSASDTGDDICKADLMDLYDMEYDR